MCVRRVLAKTRGTAEISRAMKHFNFTDSDPGNLVTSEVQDYMISGRVGLFLILIEAAEQVNAWT